MRHVYPASGTPVWIDLHNPTQEDVAQACSECNLPIPSRQELEEIETSSRLQADGDVLTLSMPITPYVPDQEPVSTPIGFVLTPKLLVTVRFDELHTFHKVAEGFAKHGAQTAPQVFAALIEAIVDYGADKLETMKAEQRALSSTVFAKPHKSHRSIEKKGRILRQTLVTIGNMGERLSEIRETLLTLQRAIPFVQERGHDWIGEDVNSRLKVATSDILSLNDFEVHLTDKVQFLLDATLGFINNQQNDMFKVLTIASIVGIPPTFVVGLYGMNFQNQPEFHWAYGYQWGLFLIALSIIVPISWFKWRGWW
ncbi:MAG TPA: magnesium transporter CorA family protein [Rhizomicrobium sp.]|jgi:magnesium transporter|nr:magnesium transporter CorA family protein [Rhizomicrobium sp.]